MLECTKEQRAGEWVMVTRGCLGEKCYLQSHLVPVVFPRKEWVGVGQDLEKRIKRPTFTSLNTSHPHPFLVLSPSPSSTLLTFLLPPPDSRPGYLLLPLLLTLLISSLPWPLLLPSPVDIHPIVPKQILKAMKSSLLQMRKSQT